MQDQKISIVEDQTVEAEDLSQYLDSDPDAQPVIRDEYVDPEQEYEAEDKKHTGLNNPMLKGVGIAGGVVATLMIGSAILSNAGNSNQAQVAKADPKDKQIAALQKQITTLSSQSEDQIADRQAAEYGRKVPPKGTAKPGSVSATKTPGTPAPARPYATSRPMTSDYTSELPASRPVSLSRSYSQPYTPSFSAPRASAPVAASAGPSNKESQLQKQVETLQNRLAEMEKKRDAQIAATPEATVQESPEVIAQAQPEPEAPQPVESAPIAQNVAMIQPQEPQAYDGGIEEAALMRGQPIVTIAAGSEGAAILDLPIYQSGQAARVLATMTSDLTDRNGSVVLPKGSKLLGYASFNGDFVSVAFESAVVGGQAVKLPGAAVAVLAGNKQPLIAKSFSGSGGASFGKTFASIALNGVSTGIGQMLQPSTSTVINGGSTIATSTSSGNTLGNAGLAALGGISNGVSSGLQTEIQRSGQVQVSAKGIKAGSVLRLVFTTDTQILSPLVVAAAVPYPG